MCDAGQIVLLVPWLLAGDTEALLLSTIQPILHKTTKHLTKTSGRSAVIQDSVMYSMQEGKLTPR